MVTACVLAILLGVVRAQQSGPQAPTLRKTPAAHNNNVVKKKKRAAPKKTDTAVAPAQPIPAQILPPVPATLMNSAPVAPKVTMESGLLTIDAPNSTLSDVLSGVQKATGAAIEGAWPSERVAVRLGPGEPEQVIAALLRGTPYDYVILGALGRQNVVTRVLLTQSGSSQSSQSSSGNSGQPGQQFSGSRGHPPPQMEDDQQPAPEQAAPEEVAQPTPSEQDQAQQPPPRQPEQPPQPTTEQPK
jgi:hypothetical protein